MESPLKLNIFALLVSFSSMTYQYSLAQLLSILYGDIVKNYILSAGLFILFLGIGGIVYDKYKEQLEDSKIIYLEIILSFCGVVCCVLPFLANVHFSSFPVLAKTFCFLNMIVIAFFSGMELPWFLSLSKKKIDTLGFDYLGMVLASFIFPFVLLPRYGVLQATAFAALVNILVVFFLCISMKSKENFKAKSLFWVVPTIIMICFSTKIEDYLITKFLL
jgi:spermidine synthase